MEHIKEILNIAVWAPSGDNSQPWRFEVRNEKLYIFNIPDRDNPILNFKQSGSYVAHGGLIENISIASPHFGYSANVSLFPDAQNKDLVASVSFENTDKKDHPLFNYIKQHTMAFRDIIKDDNDFNEISDEVTISVLNPTTIYDIQYNDTDPGTGQHDCYPSSYGIYGDEQNVLTSGIVSAVHHEYSHFYLSQPDPPQWGGIEMYACTCVRQRQSQEHATPTKWRNVAA